MAAGVATRAFLVSRLCPELGSVWGLYLGSPALFCYLSLCLHFKQDFVQEFSSFSLPCLEATDIDYTRSSLASIARVSTTHFTLLVLLKAKEYNFFHMQPPRENILQLALKFRQGSSH